MHESITQVNSNGVQKNSKYAVGYEVFDQFVGLQPDEFGENI